MKKALNQLAFTLFCCIFLILLLSHSAECIAFASNGLLIWYRNMIPTLFPFMVLSGFMIRTGLSLKIGQWLQPFLGALFRLPSQMLYAIFMGFLCGFPMGAKIVADMLEKGQITQKEGEYLLAFCNNIGPLYILGFVVPLFKYENIWKVLVLMYLIPLSYGLFLRYFHPVFSILFSPKNCTNSQSVRKFFRNTSKSKPILSKCSYKTSIDPAPNYLICFQQALSSAIEQITLLGGCMIFFNCMQIFPAILENYFFQTSSLPYITLLYGILCSFIEIGGGLKNLASLFTGTNSNSLIMFLPLCLLTFGGLSCIAQTCFIIKNTGLKISTYIRHKLIQSCIFLILLFLFRI